MMLIIIPAVNKKGMSDIFMDVPKTRIGGREAMINAVLEEMSACNLSSSLIKKHHVVADPIRPEASLLLTHPREEQKPFPR